MLLSKCTRYLIFCLLAGLISSPLHAAMSAKDYQVEEIVADIAYPWSMVFLTPHHMLVTQRTGQLRHVFNHKLSAPIDGLPDDIYVKSQGGLLDVALHPEYRDNGWIYLSYASGTDDANRLKVIRAQLEENKLINIEEVFRLAPDKDTPVHFGGRMAFLPDHTLLITTGDGFDYREDAQRLNNQLGKIVRITDQGGVPKNNPYIGETEKNLSALVFTLGHRNPQGLIYDPNRDLIISHEHGPAGGDEINIIRAGKNYGWPIITQGKDYSGAKISPFTQYPGLEQPWVDWTPSIAPSGMALYDGRMFPQMRGDLLVSTLKAKEVRWVQLQGNKVVEQSSLFRELNYRFRDVKVGPDGAIYLLVDSANGKILKVTPKPMD